MKRIRLSFALLLSTCFVLATIASASAAPITVTNTNDNGTGSLRAAMTAAVSGDTIVFSNTTAGGATNFYDGSQRTIALLTALPQFTKSVALTGPGAGALTVARSSGNSSIFRIFIVYNNDPDNQQVTVNISGLTLSNGGVNTQLNPPFPNNAGGCILSLYGTLTLSDLRITGNAAPYGGGIASVGQYTPVTILRCTFDANSATNGGAIAVMDGSVSVLSSTFLNNSASAAGGATYTGNVGNFFPTSSLTIYNSTFQTNSAPSGSVVYGAIGNPDYAPSSTTTLGSTILNSAAGASSALASGGGTIASRGYNLSNDNGGGFLGASTDQINTNPGFGAQNVSGGRIYFPLLASSPAVDRGYNYSGAATDQIGQPRTNDYYNAVAAQDGDDTDIGAVELPGSAPNQQSGPTYTINNPTTHNDGNCSPIDCTLPEAILASNGYSNSHASSAAMVLFSSSAANGATNFYDGSLHLIALTSALPTITAAITIQGPGPNGVTIQRSSAAGTPDFRIFYLHRPAGGGPTVTIIGLSIANGKADSGGGIYNDGGNLTVINCILQSNNGTSRGGAIYNSANLTVNTVVFAGNSAGGGRGGAIFHGGSSATIANSTFGSNSAGYGGAIASYGLSNGTTLAIDACTFTGNSASNGGAVYNDDTSVDINHSSFSGNSATQRGGAVFTLGDTGRLAFTGVSNSALYNNSAQDGGAVSNEVYLATDGYATTSLTNCTLSGNSASAYGAGLFNRSVSGGINYCPTCTYAETFITSCTFNSNSTAAAGSAIYNAGDPYSHDPYDGDGGAEVIVADTILNGPAGAGVNIFDAAGNSIKSNGYNLCSDAGAGALSGGSDHINTDPKLGPLQNNGGPTLTHALLPDSPARDQGLNIANLSQDQRGMPRGFDYGGAPNAAGGDGSDIGAFEDNDVLQANGTLVVNTTGDWDDGFCGTTDCTLREAVSRAQLAHGATTITFNLPGAVPHTINLNTIADTTSGGSAFLLGNVTIQGPGANQLTLRRGGTTDYRLFRVGSGATVTMSGLTITNGYLSSNAGGGIWNQGTLTLQGCAITNNYANSAGGIRTEGSLTLDRCTVSGNSAFSGAGISSQTNLSGLTTVVRNSTISGNTATNFGGGLENVAGLTQILNSTITRNTAASEGYGSGVYSHASSNTRTEVYDSIIANNVSTDLDQVSGASSYLSNGHNLVGYGTGSSAFTAAGDTRFVTNVKLGPLANNGGGTYTHALLLGSPAINTGAAASVTTDQRGLLRQSGGAVDIGAYELQPESYAFWSSYIFPTTTPANLLTADADADGDGISNGLEQVLGSNPNTRNAPSSLLQYEIQANYLVLQFGRSIYVDPAKVFAEQSLTLQPQSWNSAGITYEDMGPANSTTELIQALIPIDGAPKKFGRLRYTP